MGKDRKTLTQTLTNQSQPHNDTHPISTYNYPMEDLNLIQHSPLAAVLLFIISQMIKEFRKKDTSYGEKDRFWLHQLYEMHNVKDDDGRPIWYMSNAVGKQQEKTLIMLDEMLTTQKETMHLLERLIDKVDGMK